MQFPEPTPQLFSFNSPLGACPTCQGFGRVPGLDPDLIFPNPDLSLRQGAVAPFRTEQWSMHQRTLLRAAARSGIDPDTPLSRLSPDARNLIWAGDGDYVGVQGFFDFLASKPFKMHYRIYQARFRGYTTCPECDGYRLRPEALNVKLRVPGVDGGLAWMHIGELCELTTADAADVTDGIDLSEHDREVAGRILTEVRRRLGYLVEVGLDYLTLDRLAQTLSGGEITANQPRDVASVRASSARSTYWTSPPSGCIRATTTASSRSSRASAISATRFWSSSTMSK